MVSVEHAARRVLAYVPYLLVLIDMRYEGVQCGREASVDHHMEMGKKLLAAGQLADALSHFHAVVDGDPKNYLAYYRRATVFLAMGKSKSALPDLSKVIELKPDFTSARLQRGNLLLKQGRLDEAESDFKTVLKSNPSNKEQKEAQAQLTKADEIQREVASASASFQQHDYLTAAAHLDAIIETCVWDVASREMRAECFIQMGETGKAISDLKATSKLKSDNTPAFYKLSTIYYSLGDHEMSLNEVRECLKLDPDHKQCYSHYKQVKKLNKQIQSAETLIQEQRFGEAVSKYEAVMKTEPNVLQFSLLAKERICHALAQNQEASRAIDVCSQVLQHQPENVNALKDRAEAYVQDEQYDEAIRDYEAAGKHSENDRQIKEGLERAQRLLKQSKKRDYYKILGVKRTAQKKEIIKAYRKLAQQWHPDNFQDAEEKKQAEKKFIDIAQAKEVLTDPDMRSKFDQGEDPMDPESQQGHHHHHHFHESHHFQGFNPFGSGPFNFKFNFN
ncbi:dnaJ homolog subfamily C member 3a [Synchiropus splendidus]|uniref:dnaJ homolog subfamily C member 3a n=1 Tax=Synchiropus splendidus TaxID=270530 RepID=UPI00237DB275|nr:dnaJ homolog subfamily C member 3a [Synchiropus splendidus]